jgi:hypothetical protein
MTPVLPGADKLEFRPSKSPISTPILQLRSSPKVEELVLECAGGMTPTPVEVPESWLAPLREQFCDAQLVELTASNAWENYRARFDQAFGIKSEDFSTGDCCVLPLSCSGGAREPIPLAVNRKAPAQWLGSSRCRKLLAGSGRGVLVSTTGAASAAARVCYFPTLACRSHIVFRSPCRASRRRRTQGPQMRRCEEPCLTKSKAGGRCSNYPGLRDAGIPGRSSPGTSVEGLVRAPRVLSANRQANPFPGLCSRDAQGRGGFLVEALARLAPLPLHGLPGDRSGVRWLTGVRTTG